MSILKLQLEDAELRKTPSKEMAAEVNETKFFRDSGFYYAGTTDYSDFSVFEILEDFLQPGTETSLGAAAESILKITPDKAPLSEEVTNVGRVVLELAEQIPYYHPSHIKLARVMELLTSSPKFINESPYSSYIRGQRFKETIDQSCDGPNDEESQSWSNLNAFLAHQSATHVGLHDPSCAIRAMVIAFEEDSPDWNDPAPPSGESEIIAAAQHILWDGQELFKHVLCPYPHEETQVQPVRLQIQIWLKRWHFWKRGFEASMQESSRLSEEGRKVARKAAVLMGAIEESMSF